MSVDILALEKKQYISLPADHKYMEINCKGQSTADIANMYVISYLQIHEPRFANTLLSKVNCIDQNKILYLYCTVGLAKNINYFVYANVAANYQNNWIEQNTHYSWLVANEVCKTNGVELLYFMSRSELDEFTTILRRGDMLPFLEAVFIGLTYNGFKVSLFKIFKLN